MINRTNNDDDVYKHQNHLNLRHTLLEPYFWISLHDHDIDYNIRWSIMKYGKYYEKSQTKAFIELLSFIYESSTRN